jgi:alpha-galactosidase
MVGPRMANGSIVPDPSRFPSGLFALADELHKRGFKFGVYTSATSLTCQDRPGSYEFEDVDMQSYCAWGVVSPTSSTA